MANGIARDQPLPRPKVVEAEQLTASEISLLLSGAVAGLHLREMVEPDACRVMCNRFRESTEVFDRTDDKVDSLGAFHYDQPLDTYLALAKRLAAELDYVGGPESPIGRLASLLGHALAELGFRFRLAQHEGVPAGPYRISSWQAEGRYSLHPHEDFSQTKDPKQAGFEVQEVHDIFAVNIYISAPPGVGGLLIWNALDTDPAEQLGHVVPSPETSPTVVQVSTGDVVILNGKYPHAVDQAFNRSNADRLVANFFFAPLRDDEFIQWI